MIQPRPYQTAAIAAFLQFVADGGLRGLLVLPTGVGKTATALLLAKEMEARTLWVAHRDELIIQPLKALANIWPEAKAGVVKAERNEWARQVVFASVQTAWRPGRIERLTGFDLVVIDEAHRAPAATYRKVLDQVGSVPVLGLTATPERTDQTRLDDVFEKIVYQLALKTAVEQGYLVDVEMVGERIRVDLDKVGLSGGDYKTGELDTALLEAGIVKEIVTAVDKHARDRKTIIFVVSVRQAQETAEALCASGLKATWVAGVTPKAQRRQRLAALESGEVTHIVNALLLVEGFDCPSVDCILMARPTQSKPLYIQVIGRGLRIAPGKDNCLIIDMVGMGRRHNMIQAPVIFGVEKQLESGRVTGGYDDDLLRSSVRERLLLSQIKGVAPVARSKLRWVPSKNGVLALNCGEGGTVLMRPAEEDWTVEVVGRKDGDDRELLTTAPVDLEFAQGIAEDYVRRAGAVYLSQRSSRWRRDAATDKQLAALKRRKITHHADITKGEASELLTQAEASSWRHEPATWKQIARLKRMGAEFDEKTLTKGEAGKLIGANK